MSKPKSIQVEIDRKVFRDIIDYFGIDSNYIQDQYNININEQDPDLTTTIARLRRLSKYLKLPVSVFFMSERPPFPDPPKDYRKVSRINFSKNTINAIRSGYWYQEFLYEQTDLRNEFNIRFTLNDDPIESGTQISDLLEFEGIRKKSRNAGVFLRNIRAKLDTFNIFTFKAKFPPEETRGFSLSEREPPIIVINSSENDRARIFTVLHELGHILLNKSGISEPFDIKENVDPVERWCDKFASSIIIPKGSITDRDLRDSLDIGPYISELSGSMMVSKHSIALNLLLNNTISWEQYNEWVSRPYTKKEDDKGFLIPRINIITSQKGKKFTLMIKELFENNAINQTEVREILEINDNDKAFDDLLILE